MEKRKLCATEGCNNLAAKSYKYKGKQYYKKYCDKCITLKYPKKQISNRYMVYKYQATKKRGLEFTITKEDFINFVEQKCHYCGGKGYGVDRVDNSVGYILSNCVPCCTVCNKMKSNRDKEDFIKQCKKIAYYSKSIPPQNFS